MKVASVDDEQNMTKQIEAFLDRFRVESQMEVEARTFHDSRAFVETYDGSYDLVLLDVEMPGVNGIEAAKAIRGRDGRVSIMFITNMAQYAIHGYEVEAVDYVLKPLGYQDFAMKMKKALRYIERDASRQLVLDATDGKRAVKVSDIVYVEVIRHYLNFHTDAGVYEVRGVMREWEDRLWRYHFARCSQSYLVNLARVRSIQGNKCLAGGAELPLSRNRKNEFIQAFTRYVGGMD